MTVNHNDPMSEQFYADLDHIMERITGIVDAESYGKSMHELDAMTDRGGRIASMLAHPAWKEN